MIAEVYTELQQSLTEWFADDDGEYTTIFQSLAEMMDEWFSDAQGFSQQNIPTDLMLVVTELAEACEGDRKHAESDKIPGFTAVEEELADALVRIFHMAGKYKLRLGEAFNAKMLVNLQRPYKHGKGY